jgi:hypothetical protein
MALENRRFDGRRRVRVGASRDQPLNRPAIIERGSLRKVQPRLAPDWFPADDRSDNDYDGSGNESGRSGKNGYGRQREWFHNGIKL